MSFMRPMKDKTHSEYRLNVLHEADEGQNPPKNSLNVLHKADEEHNPPEYRLNVLHKADASQINSKHYIKDLFSNMRKISIGS
jgi:hypothetical protein